MNENPYHPPTLADTENIAPTTRRFRWGLIPATFCWGLFVPVALLWSGVCIVRTMQSWQRFAELWATGERAIPLLAVALPPLSVCFVIVVLACGSAWKNGRWLRAITLSAVIGTVMPGSETLSSQLIPSVYVRILLTNEIPDFVSVRGDVWHRPPGL